jgi:hypothetical protein
VDDVYLGADGIHVNIPLEEHKLCLLVMIGVRSAGREELVALADGYRESTEGGRICCATPPAAGCAPRSSRSATGRWDVVVVDVRINTVAFVGELSWTCMNLRSTPSSVDARRTRI